MDHDDSWWTPRRKNSVLFLTPGNIHNDTFLTRHSIPVALDATHVILCDDRRLAADQYAVKIDEAMHHQSLEFQFR
eukprot:CAMPEP_0201534932 /NCGR_PEP_ID=MMETSP0161_2-20130828/57511_1 /ASSEMBLY_ACC=CAM_ASM_000251 /TAXON_ID=180227 /ORGANISM="Neoparamoeba aestuarina, Strain SoJaBio B1-5/56/2" /LENGTH=75 /DNA_ID=CAMNT_0047939813 /DNA_START=249 /DNA_END=473 /DNA_ORIENTATION=-